MPAEVDAVQRAKGLSLECGHVAVEIDAEVVPCVFFPSGEWGLHEEGLQFCLGAVG